MTMQITFEWRNVTYTVARPGNPIIIPTTGEVLKGDGWQREIFPPEPGDLTVKFVAVIRDLDELNQLASAIGGNIAWPVIMHKTTVCPSGCDQPTSPYCSQCGKATEYDYTYTPMEFFGSHSPLEDPQEVMGDGPCPNCKTSLHHCHDEKCPNCGQTLEWMCL